MSNRLKIDLIFWKFNECYENVDQKEKLHYDVETVTDLSYLCDRINSSGGCEAL